MRSEGGETKSYYPISSITGCFRETHVQVTLAYERGMWLSNRRWDRVLYRRWYGYCAPIGTDTLLHTWEVNSHHWITRSASTRLLRETKANEIPSTYSPCCICIRFFIIELGLAVCMRERWDIVLLDGVRTRANVWWLWYLTHRRQMNGVDGRVGPLRWSLSLYDPLVTNFWTMG